MTLDEDKLAEEFAKILQDPDKLEAFKRKVALDEFKEKYNVERASPLKCPACSEAGYVGGSLWFNKDNPSRAVCRKCLLEWTIQCENMSNEALIWKIREASK